MASGNIFRKYHICLNYIWYFSPKLRLHVLGIDKNINAKGAAHVQDTKQNCANLTGSQMHVVWRAPDEEMLLTSPRVQYA